MNYIKMTKMWPNQKRAGMGDHTSKLLDEAKEKITQQSDLIDDLFEAMNDIHKECFNEFADDDEDVIERIRIIAYRAIQNAKGEQQ